MKRESSSTAQHVKDLALIGVIGLTCIFAIAEVIALILDRRVGQGITFKEVDLAAWVQAVGSVVAIFATFGAVLTTHWAEKARAVAQDKERHRRLLLTVCLILDDCVAIANEIGTSRTITLHKETAADRMRQKEALELLLDQLRGVPLQELPTGHAISRTMDAIRLLKRAIRKVGADGPENEVRHGWSEYGNAWLPIHAYFKDYSYYLRWELAIIDEPSTPYPGD